MRNVEFLRETDETGCMSTRMFSVFDQERYAMVPACWINGKGWGTYHQTIDEKGKMQKEITVLYGNIDDVKVE